LTGLGLRLPPGRGDPFVPGLDRDVA